MRDRLSGVYAIRNLQTGRVYIGASVDIQRRFTGHLRTLENGKHQTPSLQADWLTYGGDAFSFEILETVESADDLGQREADCIATARKDGETYNSAHPSRYVAIRPRERTGVRESLTVPEVATALHVDMATVVAWLSDKTIRGAQLYRSWRGWRIPESEVRRLLGGDMTPH